MNIKPINKRVLVKTAVVENVSKGGIIIPDSSKDRPMSGTVVAVADDITSSIKENDIIFFSAWAGLEIPNLEGFLMLKEEEIIGKIDE